MLKASERKIQVCLGLALLFSLDTARAQSSVNLYGEVDGGLLYTSNSVGANGQSAGHQFSMIDGGAIPSMFGMTGTEDLGGGLKAIFKLESGIDVANGGFNNSNGNFFGRQAWVALDGNFGTVTAGLQYSPLFLASVDTDARDAAEFGSGLINYVDNAVLTGLFNANAVSYASPTIGGFQGRAMYAFGGEAGDFQAGRQYSASLRYSAFNFTIDAAYFDGNAGGTAPAESNLPVQSRLIGAAYKFGDLTVKASFTNFKVSGSFNNNVYSFGLSYQATTALLLNGGVYVTSDRNDTSNNSWMAAIGTTYSLSKATSLYAQVGVVNNHGSMDTGLSITGLLYGPSGTTTGVDIGILHRF